MIIHLFSSGCQRAKEAPSHMRDVPMQKARAQRGDTFFLNLLSAQIEGYQISSSPIVWGRQRRQLGQLFVREAERDKANKLGRTRMQQQQQQQMRAIFIRSFPTQLLLLHHLLQLRPRQRRRFEG
jgi:hypothetical protein